MKHALLGFALLLPFTASAQDSCSAIRDAKSKTYGFMPTQLDESAQKAKSKEMDQFWALIKKDKKNGAACLRELLTAETKDGFFLFDGASLMFEMEPSPEDTQVVLSSLLRADMDEVDPGGHVSLLMRLAKAGADVGPHARRYLEQRRADTYLAMHAMKMDRFMGALLIYGCMPVEQSDRYLKEVLQSSNKEAQAVAAMVLALNLTETSFRALAEFKGLSVLPEEVGKEIASLRTHSPSNPSNDTPRFSRAEVLEYIRLIPHTETEYMQAQERELKYEEKHPEFRLPEKYDEKKMSDIFQRRLNQGPPFTSLAGYEGFIKSAIVTLTEEDLSAIREARRKAIHGLSDETMYEFYAYTRIMLGVINRLDLFKEYRIH